MSTDDPSTPVDPPILDEGLVKFYSAEAEALLAQYRRVDFLLGPDSTDHTHSGTLCEVLLRDYFRRVLLPWMGVDKGFVYGRSEDGRSVDTSPEIDILIHDQRMFRPIFRLDDFVIVQPEAVLGIVQVKKRLITSGTNPLKKGLENVVNAKRHVLTQMLRRKTELQFMNERSPRLVGAVIGFDGRTKADTYWDYLDCEFAKHVAFSNRMAFDVPGCLYSLPNFVGSLNGRFCLRQEFDKDGVMFRCYPSSVGRQNVAGQMLADICASLIWGDRYTNSSRPPFQYPIGFTHESEHNIQTQ